MNLTGGPFIRKYVHCSCYIAPSITISKWGLDYIYNEIFLYGIKTKGRFSHLLAIDKTIKNIELWLILQQIQWEYIAVHNEIRRFRSKRE